MNAHILGPRVSNPIIGRFGSIGSEVLQTQQHPPGCAWEIFENRQMQQTTCEAMASVTNLGSEKCASINAPNNSG